ncbi:MAG: HAD hydrolase-like protein [Verrucomicrobiales bacterium]|nr:HAD hydrolase-like protein [Verrucomicrobiales bacterium]
MTALFQPHNPSADRDRPTPAAILFDLDGTLIDSGPGIINSIRHALAELGREPPSAAALRWCVGPPLTVIFQRLLRADDPALIASAVAAYRRRYQAGGMFEAAVYPGIPAALARLKARGPRLYVATSKPEIFARQILTHFGLARYFTAIHGSALDGARADKTALIAHALTVTNPPRARALMVGDRATDILGARRNGLRAAAVTYGYGVWSELAAARPARFIRHPAQLPVLSRWR